LSTFLKLKKGRQRKDYKLPIEAPKARATRKCRRQGNFVQGTYYPIRCGLIFLRFFMNFQGQTPSPPLNFFPLIFAQPQVKPRDAKPDDRCPQPTIGPKPLDVSKSSIHMLPGSSSRQPSNTRPCHGAKDSILTNLFQLLPCSLMLSAATTLPAIVSLILCLRY
jgi:hypothetical protein